MENRPLSRQVGDNVRHWRKERGSSLAEVSARMADLGVPLSLNGLSKVELGNRGLDLDELVALARTLRVPPVVLIFPFSRAQQVELLPGTQVPTWPAAKWFAGDGPWPGEYLIPSNNSVILDLRAHDEAVEDWLKSKKRADDHRAAAARESDARKRDDYMKVAELEDDSREKFHERSLRQIRQSIREWGCEPDELPAELAHVDGADDGER